MATPTKDPRLADVLELKPPPWLGRKGPLEPWEFAVLDVGATENPHIA